MHRHVVRAKCACLLAQLEYVAKRGANVYMRRSGPCAKSTAPPPEHGQFEAQYAKHVKMVAFTGTHELKC